MDKDAPEIQSPDCQTAREEMDEFLQGMESRHQELLARLDHQDAALRHSLSELGSEFADRWLLHTLEWLRQCNQPKQTRAGQIINDDDKVSLWMAEAFLLVLFLLLFVVLVAADVAVAVRFVLFVICPFLLVLLLFVFLLFLLLVLLFILFLCFSSSSSSEFSSSSSPPLILIVMLVPWVVMVFVWICLLRQANSANTVGQIIERFPRSHLCERSCSSLGFRKLGKRVGGRRAHCGVDGPQDERPCIKNHKSILSIPIHVAIHRCWMMLICMTFMVTSPPNCHSEWYAQLLLHDRFVMMITPPGQSHDVSNAIKVNQLLGKEMWIQRVQSHPQKRKRLFCPSSPRCGRAKARWRMIKYGKDW